MRMPNHSIQRMGASRLAQLQLGSPWRLAPVHLCPCGQLEPFAVCPPYQPDRSAADDGRDCSPLFYSLGSFGRCISLEVCCEGSRVQGFLVCHHQGSLLFVSCLGRLGLPMDEDQIPVIVACPNKRAGGDGGMSVLFRAGRACPAAPQHGRWT